MIKKATTSAAADFTAVGSDIKPATNAIYSLGTTSLRWGNAHINQLLDSAGVARFVPTGSNSNTFRGAASASGTGHLFYNNTTLTSGKIASFHAGNGSTERCFLDYQGQYENTVAGNGIILVSPDGTRYRITVANGGTVSVAAA